MIEANSDDGVTLHRVVCCYPDADALVGVAGARARRVLGLVLPRERWYVRWAIRAGNVRWWLTRSQYRGHAHPNSRIDELVGRQGLTPVAEAFTASWRVVLYARSEAETSMPASS